MVPSLSYNCHRIHAIFLAFLMISMHPLIIIFLIYSKYTFSMISKTKLMVSIITILTITLIPIAGAQVGNTDTKTTFEIGTIIPDDNTVGPAGIINDLNQAHSVISNIMIDHSSNDYSIADELVFTATYVDTEKQELVVILDPILLSLGLHYDEGDIEDILESEILPIRLEYGVFITESHIRESSQSKIDFWINLYNSRCTSPTDNGLCDAIAFNLETHHHYILDSNSMWHPSTAEISDTPRENVKNAFEL